MTKLAAAPNVHLFRTDGPSPTGTDVPRLLKWCDVGVIPFAVTPSTETMLPIKLFEYLALGLPVVSTPLGEVCRFDDLVSIAGPNEFVTAVERELATDSPARRERRAAVARDHAWERRVEEMTSLIAQQLRGQG